MDQAVHPVEPGFVTDGYGDDCKEDVDCTSLCTRIAVDFTRQVARLSGGHGANADPGEDGKGNGTLQNFIPHALPLLKSLLDTKALEVLFSRTGRRAMPNPLPDSSGQNSASAGTARWYGCTPNWVRRRKESVNRKEYPEGYQLTSSCIFS